MIIRSFVKAFMDVNIDTRGLKKEDDKFYLKWLRILLRNNKIFFTFLL